MFVKSPVHRVSQDRNTNISVEQIQTQLLKCERMCFQYWEQLALKELDQRPQSEVRHILQLKQDIIKNHFVVYMMCTISKVLAEYI